MQPDLRPLSPRTLRAEPAAPSSAASPRGEPTPPSLAADSPRRPAPLVAPTTLGALATPSAASKMATQDALLRRQATHPCERIEAAHLEPGDWEGVALERLATARNAAPPQSDDWSCMTNSAARAVAAATGRILPDAAYTRFKDQCPRLPAWAFGNQIRAFFRDPQGAVYSKLLEHHPYFGPTPRMLAQHIQQHLGVSAEAYKAACPATLQRWLADTCRTGGAAVVLMFYGHTSMHYVSLMGFQPKRGTAVLMDTSGTLYAMRADTLIHSMCGQGKLAHEAGVLARFNAVAIASQPPTIAQEITT